MTIEASGPVGVARGIYSPPEMLTGRLAKQFEFFCHSRRKNWSRRPFVGVVNGLDQRFGARLRNPAHEARVCRCKSDIYASDPFAVTAQPASRIHASARPR